MRNGGSTQHSVYVGNMKTLHAQISDKDHRKTYEDAEELTQALEGLLMSQILDIDDESADEDGPNDIDTSRMNETTRNDDYSIGGSPAI